MCLGGADLLYGDAGNDTLYGDAGLAGGFGGAAGDTVIVIDSDASGSAIPGDEVVALVQGVAVGLFDAADFILSP